MTLLLRDRHTAGPRTRRPAVVEHVDSPQSTSDGRTTTTAGLRTQLGWFAVIGFISTLAWAGLYGLLRGAGFGSVVANGVALVVTTVGNTAANRRLTFGVSGRAGLARHHGAGLVAFLVAIALTTAAATVLDRLVPHASRLAEIAVLAAANVFATGMRFALLRTWIGRPSPLPAT